ncbi:MAG: S-methyl-5'-thioadenosine phosphorylase [Deltaproteobacteria bacterium]|nr:S-methyl-5'-thioadenosine phosphorylase [Deltaproteobacteria bacterium]
MAQAVKLGVIGGSGLYQIAGITPRREHRMETPFGAPSDAIVEAEVAGRSVYFLPRHGIGHRLTPSEVPYRANIHAIKQLGVTHLLAVSACGIMRADIVPGDMVVPDQIYDRTKGVRESTFFGDGIVGHVTFAEPFCPEMRGCIIDAAKAEGARVHARGTYVCMEGPAFSTRAESEYYRKTLAPAVIGMTAIPEAKLAREAELCYGMLALATDYDCWHDTHASVTVAMVLEVLRANSELANRIVKRVAEILPVTSESPMLSAAKNAVMTRQDQIPAATKARLQLLYGKYFK